MSFWKVLKIDPTDDKRIIQKAYSELLSIYHPEENPEEFQKIHKAYKEAMKYLKQNKTQQYFHIEDINIIEPNNKKTYDKPKEESPQIEAAGFWESYQPKDKIEEQDDLEFDIAVNNSEQLWLLERQLIEELRDLPKYNDKADWRRWKAFFNKATLEKYLVVPDIEKHIWQYIQFWQYTQHPISTEVIYGYKNYRIVAKAIKRLSPEDAIKLSSLNQKVKSRMQEVNKYRLIVISVLLAIFGGILLLMCGPALARNVKRAVIGNYIENYFEDIYEKDFKVKTKGTSKPFPYSPTYLVYTVTPGKNSDSSLYDIEQFFYYLDEEVVLVDEYKWQLMQSIAREEGVQLYNYYTSSIVDNIPSEELWLFYINSHGGPDNYVESFANAEKKLQNSPILKGTKIKVNIRKMHKDFINRPPFLYEIIIGEKTDIEDFKEKFIIHDETYWN